MLHHRKFHGIWNFKRIPNKEFCNREAEFIVPLKLWYNLQTKPFWDPIFSRQYIHSLQTFSTLYDNAIYGLFIKILRSSFKYGNLIIQNSCLKKTTWLFNFLFKKKTSLNNPHHKKKNSQEPFIFSRSIH